MAQTVTLDALIPRADFREADDNPDSSVAKIKDINISQLSPESFLVPSLRKPDFQRETNHWSPDQVLKFLKSFLDNELVPSVILWKSKTYFFVIDGAHRMSALLSWINDDYGDGIISQKFFGESVTEAQKRLARRLRNKINAEVGSFSDMKKVMLDPSVAGDNSELLARANNAKTRSIDLQWVEGDAEKAESSFFNINKQGTPLHDSEERLLRNRAKPIAIVARSVVRAGSGHKYWGAFEQQVQVDIEKRSSEMHQLLFSPEISFPIKTLNLPHGGQASPISAYNLMMDLLALCSAKSEKPVEGHYLYQPDADGAATIAVLEDCKRVLTRMTSNKSKSLGLHPAVFFYSERGRHMDTVFLAMAAEISVALGNNDASFFKRFTDRRELIEGIFLKNKFLLYQANQLFGSKLRIQKWRAFLRNVVLEGQLIEGYSQNDLLAALGLKDKVIAEGVAEPGKNFSTETKSAIFLQASLDQATKCPLCGGLVHVEKAAQYDHIQGKAVGGIGSLANGQITHPYCNSIKN